MQTQAMDVPNLVVKTIRDGVAILTLNRPTALNAMNRDLIEALAHALKELEDAPDVHAIILTGAGEKAFCAGADIAGMQDMAPHQAMEWGRRGQALGTLIENHPKLVIAAVNGYALGGGMELAMACDWVVASPNAKFGQPEVRIGVVPGFGGTQRLTRHAGRQVAKWMCTTGEQIDAETAHRLGIVLRIAPQDKLVDECVKMVAPVAANAPIAVRLVKELVHQGANIPLDAACALELDAFALTFSTKDQKEGMKAFVEKRRPSYTGQ